MKTSVTLMRCTLPLFYLFLLFSFNPLRANEVPTKLIVYFDSDVHELDPEEQDRLCEFISPFQDAENVSIEIHGHTDTFGGDEYNLKLSQRRGETTKDLLVDIGFSAHDIASKSYGKFALLKQEDNAQSHQANRRVEIIVTLHEFHSAEELNEVLTLETEYDYRFNANESNHIISNRGTHFLIPANALLNADGSTFNGHAEMELTEALSAADFLTENLSTVCDGEVLESGGMLYISLKDEFGNPLSIDEESPMEVAIPSGMLQPGMTLFVSSDGSDWSNTSQPIVTTAVPNLPLPPPYPAKLEWKEPKSLLKLPKKPASVPTPMKPVYPEALEKPEKINYKWWQFKKKRRQRLEPIVETVDPRMERYERAYENYVNDSLAYPAKLEQYEKAVGRWEIETASCKKHYEQVIIPREREKFDFQNIEIQVKYDESIEAWREKCDEIRDVHYAKLTEANLLNSADLNAYAFRLAQTGWINCDRFYDIPKSQKQDIMVSVGGHDDAKVYLVFDDRKSVLRANHNGNFAEVNNVPKESITVIAYYVEDGDIMLGQSKVSKYGRAKASYKKASLTEFRQVMAQLGE